ncbi:DUF222 domain-containing protein [Rhodococcus sp. G-MC3]|uniref:HNH endonuclease signature motif containing protein n=1 Tax=Rhodococcus sp. G-MC3 TaxID=3046209 RepID=UPI0024B88E2C|nr:DUF222 domain-containing protein [Rhodococcus sp. G-MC3]MDJ0393724.1 DUF222 domain-containing protein [Rhodococcus sp. G-MC3]
MDSGDEHAGVTDTADAVLSILDPERHWGDSEDWFENLHSPCELSPTDAEFEVEKFARWFESFPLACDPFDTAAGHDSGVEPAEAVDPSVPVIEAAYLAKVVAIIEEQVEILGRIDNVVLCNSDRRALLVRAEAVHRALFGFSHTWIADVIAQHGLDDIPGSVPYALSSLMRFSSKRAGQRIRLANHFGHRSAMSGERLAPEHAATAAAAADGVLDEEHQIIVKKFFTSLSRDIDIETRENADRQLAELARQLGPEEFDAAAKRLFDTLDPDGKLVDEEQVANRCFFKFSDQGEDGLSKGTFVVDAETRAYLEAAFAKWAKPGMCNPADDKPVVDDPADDPAENPADGPADGATGGATGGSGSGPGEPGGSGSGNTGADLPDPSLFDSDSPSPDDTDTDGESDPDSDRDSVNDADADAARRAERDHRSQGRRQHDALKVIVRQMLASGQLGTHRGLPVTAVLTMTLADLEAATGYAVTATGSLVRMRDAIRMAAHAHHYLAIFDDDGRALHLGRSRRIASADQRIVLIASDRGCTFPGCTRPATWSQVHHIDEWGAGGGTDIASLTFGCDMHHRLVGSSENDWATTKAGPDHPYPGRTLWHPPVTLDPTRTGVVNHYHHPNEYIYPAAPGTEGIPGPSPDPSPDPSPADQSPGPGDTGGPEPGGP